MKRNRAWILLAFAVMAFSPALAAERPLVVSGATLIDGTGKPPVADAVVVIRDGRIVTAGPRASVKVPKNARVLDARGKWVMPGLIDTHVHFFQSAGLYARPDVIDLRKDMPYPKEVARVKERLSDTFQRYLCSGVTAVVDVGGPFWNFQVRDAAAKSDRAPRVAVAGPLVSTLVPPELEVEDPPIIRAQSEGEARALVRRLLARKPDLVKIWFIRRPDQTLEDATRIVSAAIEESHAGGLRVAVHATELDTAKAAIRAGSDVLVHSVFNAPVDDAFIALAKERHTILEPTLVVYEGYAEVLGKEVDLADVECACGDAQAVASWAQAPAPPAAVKQSLAALRANIETAQKNLKRLADAGVVIAAGTDAGNIGTLHGPSLHRELELMAAAGLTPMQVLVAATRDAAQVFAEKPDFGTLEVGKRADLLVLDADPLVDVRNARRIRQVVKGGKVFERATLETPVRTTPCPE